MKMALKGRKCTCLVGHGTNKAACQ